MLIDKVPWVAHILGRGKVRLHLLVRVGRGGRGKEGGRGGCSWCASTSLLPTTPVSPSTIPNLFLASFRHIERVL